MQNETHGARFATRWGEDPGWRGCIGFITVPNISLSFLEFLKIAPEGYVATEQHTYMTKDGMPTKFDFTVEGINEAVSQMEHAARVLKVLGVDLIAQSGTPYSFCHEGGFAFSRELRAKIEKDTGLPVVMMGLAVSTLSRGWAVRLWRYPAPIITSHGARNIPNSSRMAGLRCSATRTGFPLGSFLTRSQ